MTQAPPGWHPDAHDPALLRWWDGAQWTPQTSTREAVDAQLARAGLPHAPAPARPALGGGWGMLAVATQLALMLILVLDGALVALSLTYVSTLQQWRADLSSLNDEQAVLLDVASNVLTITWWLLFVTIGVLFISWLYLAHRSDRMDPRSLQHASGWAIGGWFVPILNLWRPVQMVRDVFRGAGAPVPVVVGLWWTALILGRISSRASAAAVPDEDLEVFAWIDAAITSWQVDIVTWSLDLVAALLAIVVVRRTTRAVLRDRSAAVPGVVTVL